MNCDFVVPSVSNRESTANSNVHPVTIRFPQVDNAGIVFYPRYIELLLKHFPDLPLFSTPTAFAIEFRKPNRLGDRVEIVHDAAASPDEWSITGRMNGDDYFTVRPLAPELSMLSPDAHPAQTDAFATPDIPVGEWMSDRHGHMYLSRYFETLNVAVEKWFEATLDLPFHQLHVDRRVGIPTVRFQTKCRKLPKVGDTVNVLFRPLRIGSRSMTSRSWMASGDECLVETEQVIVFVRMQENGYETIEIPGYVRDAFAAQLEE